MHAWTTRLCGCKCESYSSTAGLAVAEDLFVRPPEGGELIDFLGPFGSVGMTAYFGFFDVGKPKAGEVLVVSGAAGATGQ